jgi:NAD(P) transhydrogenase subunit alpha
MTVRVAVARETATGERRVALTPETCKKLIAAGATCASSAARHARAVSPMPITAKQGALVGRRRSTSRSACADVVLCVQAPDCGALSQLKKARSSSDCCNRRADAARGAQIQARKLASPSRSNACRAPRARRRWTC